MVVLAATPPARDRTRSKLRWQDVALAALSGGLLVPSFPAFDLGALAFIGLVPLLVALDGKRPLAGFLLGYASGLVFFPGVFHWALSIRGYHAFDHLLLALYLSTYFGIFGLAFAWVRARTRLPAVVVAPVLWVAAEYLRGHAFFLSFPWLLLGYSQYLHHALIQITAWTGVYGLSFLLVLVNASLAGVVVHATRSRRQAGSGARPSLRRPLVAAGVVAILIGAVDVHGRVVLSRPLPGETVRVAVLQGNVPQQQATRTVIVDRYEALTRQVAAARPALIVWPETAVPTDIKHDPSLARRVVALARETGTPLLVGSSQHAKFSRANPQDPATRGKFYNTMFLISAEGRVVDEYRKIILVPFGEYEPLKGVIEWPSFIAAGFGLMLPGERHTVFSIAKGRFGAVICWEAMFPGLFREFVRGGAGFMISATNESWFGPTSAPYQLLAMTAIRAAENRTAVARAASTGLSAFIDPYGRIGDPVRDESGRELFVAGFRVHDVPIRGASTFYTRHGDVFAALQLGLAAVLLLAAARRHLRADRGPERSW